MKIQSYTYILLCVILLSNCQQTSTATKDSSDSSSIKANQSVEVVNPSVRSFNSAQIITGNIRADQSVYLHAMEQGVVSSINVDIGDKVNRGQTIARLSNPLINLELKGAEIQLLEAQANLQGTKADLKMNQTKQKAAQSLYDKIAAVYKKSTGLTTVIELENAKRDAELADAYVEVAQANISRSMAKIDAAKLTIESIKERLRMLSIVAPFSGVVTGRYVDKGAMVQNALTEDNAKPIVSISNIDPVRLILPIPESSISGIQKGDEVDIEFPSLAGQDIKATISRISKNLDPASKTMEIQIDIPNKMGKIKTGMYAKAKIKRSSSNTELSLPITAIYMKKDAPYVFVVVDGIVEEIKLKKGLSGKDYFQVLNDNIKTDSKVIIKGKSMVKSGQAVQAILK